MIGTKITKTDFDHSLYHECARWCNSTQQGIIKDQGDYYEVVTNPNYQSDEVVARNAEIASLKKYLEETDYMVVKCLERGLEMKYEYPEDYVNRQNARDRINILENEANS